MAKKKRVQKTKSGKASPKPSPSKTSTAFDWKLLIAPLLCIAFALFIYIPGLDQDFTNWDDTLYVTENPLVQNWSPETRSILFDTETNIAGNYHPLTMLSLAWDFDRGKEFDQASGRFNTPARVFKQTSLALHILNGLLAYLFILLLTRSWQVAGLAALLFIAHPLHVESVSWVSGRKDLTYTLFFLASLSAYLHYVRKNKTLFLLLSFVLFIPSLLSKPAAVVLPLVLILIDLFEKRKLNAKLWLEKALFLVPAILLGLLTIQTQTESEAVGEFGVFSIWERLMFASYGFITYIVKFFVPTHLSAFHPYPLKDSIGVLYYIYPLFALSLIGLGIWSFRKRPVISFAVFFYAINLALVLQFVSVGNAIIAERYTYVPYLGLALLVFWPLSQWLKEKGRAKTFGLPVLLSGFLFSAVLAYASQKRTEVWTDTYSLWTDVIEKYPMRVAKSYNNRGLYLKDNGEPERALKDYNIGIQLEPDNHLTYNSRGNVYAVLAKRNKEKREEYLRLSVEDLSKAIEIRSDHYQSYNSRGLSYMDQKEYEKALADYNKALEIKPDHWKVYINRAGYYLSKGDFEQALKDYDTYLKVYPSDVQIKGGKAFALFRKGDHKSSLRMSEECLKADPENPKYMYLSSLALNGLERHSEALAQAQRAATLGYSIPPRYMRELKRKARKNG